MPIRASSPRSRLSRVAAPLALSLSLALSSPALAETTAENAKERFVEAQALYDAGQFGAALPLFQEVYDVTQSPNAQLYIARSLRELGRTIEAYEAMAGLLKLATERAATEDKYVPTRDAAAAELALLEQRIGRVVVAFADPPPDLSVRVGGQSITADRIGAAIPVAPGDITIEAEAPGMKTEQKTISVAAGRIETVALVLSPLDSPDTPGAPTPKPEEGGGLTGLQIAGIVTAGVGVVGLGVFAITGAMSQGKFNDVEAACNGQRCTDPAFADDIDSGKTLETVANVSLVAGGVLLLAGAGMIVFGGDDGGSKLEAKSTLVLEPSPTGASIRWSGAF